MPGIDKTRFNAEIDDELLCGICLAVFDDPLVTQCCKQTYCSDCIREWLNNSKTCPNDRKALTNRKLSQPQILVVNLLNKQKLKCEFYENGCRERDLIYGRYKQHIRECRYNPEVICSECKEKNGQLSEHNCVNILCNKFQCIANLRTSNVELETIKEELIVKNANLETELLNVKKLYDEQSVSFGELNRSSNEARKRGHDCSESVETKKQRLSQSVTIVGETSSQSMPELTTYEQHVNGCCNTKSICDDNSGESNEQISEQNCFNNLLAQHKCVQNLQTKLKDLEINNKQLIDKNASLEMQLLNVKKEHDEQLKQLSDKFNSFSVGLLGDKNMPEKTINESRQSDGQLSLKNTMNEKNSALEEKCNRYMLELSDVKNKSQQTITELNEKLSQNMVKYEQLIDTFNQLYHTIELFEKNIDRLSLIRQTKLGKVKLTLKVNINEITQQMIISETEVKIRGLWWNLRAKLFLENNVEYLSVYLVCNSESELEMWSCIASAELSIEEILHIPQNTVAVVRRNVHRFSCLYSNDDNETGYDTFMPWNVVIDNNNGYVRDNTILLNAYVSVW